MSTALVFSENMLDCRLSVSQLCLCWRKKMRLHSFHLRWKIHRFHHLLWATPCVYCSNLDRLSCRTRRWISSDISKLEFLLIKYTAMDSLTLKNQTVHFTNQNSNPWYTYRRPFTIWFLRGYATLRVLQDEQFRLLQWTNSGAHKWRWWKLWGFHLRWKEFVDNLFLYIAPTISNDKAKQKFLRILP